MRGQIDAAGYKEYIFPLLFFKRISDVYDEQFEGFVCEGGVEYAGMQVEDLPIRIPDGAHWRDVREVTENVGNKLVEAFIAIEQANPAKEMDGRKIGGLEGIFGPKDGWTNKAKMPDSIITSLIEDFSKYTLMRWGRHTNTLLESLPMMPEILLRSSIRIEQSFSLWLKYCSPNRMKVFMTRLAVPGECWLNVWTIFATKGKSGRVCRCSDKR